MQGFSAVEPLRNRLSFSWEQPHAPTDYLPVGPLDYPLVIHATCDAEVRVLSPKDLAYKVSGRHGTHTARVGTHRPQKASSLLTTYWHGYAAIWADYVGVPHSIGAPHPTRSLHE